MTNTTRMPWMKEDYTATKRAFKKRLGIFDKDVAIEEQVRMEEESERMMIELDERHERESEERWEDGYEEREMERQLENQEQDRIEGDHEQRLLEAASENKNTMAWKDAIRIIQMLVFDHCNNAVGQSDDWAKSNEEIKQAWERILQG